MKTSPHLQKGVGLIEVLVTLIIFSVGLLGLAALQNRALQAEYEAYQRSQALILLQDMASRLRTNRASAPCYDLELHSLDYLGTTTSTPPTCTSYGSSESQALVTADLAAWHQALRGSAETTAAGASIGAITDARGCINRNADDTYTVAVAWQGLGPTVANTAILCGQGSYGDDDAWRRVVWTTVRFADLK